MLLDTEAQRAQGVQHSIDIVGIEEIADFGVPA